MHGNRHKSGEEAAREGTRTAPLLAVLDLGTNNCRLLIATPAPGTAQGGGAASFRVVDSFSRIVRLGEGVNQTGLLSEAALDRTIAALKICSERIAKYNVKHVRAIATQAARLARNADVLVRRARDEAGIALEVISPDQEADLAALGCAPLIGRKYKGALIFDIGGGSTEIIWLQKGPARPEKTGRLGAGGRGQLAEAWSRFDQLATASAHAGGSAQPFEGFARQTGESFDRKHHLLGTSGTVTTLAADRPEAAALQSRQGGWKLA